MLLSAVPCSLFVRAFFFVFFLSDIVSYHSNLLRCLGVCVLGDGGGGGGGWGRGNLCLVIVSFSVFPHLYY